MQVYFFILYFFTYGFLGWCTEVAYATTKQHKFVNRGFLNGPICPIYGIGVGVVVQFLTPVRENLILLYITSTILVTLIEWVTGLLMDKIFHHKWWDYSGQPLNIGGYVCLLFSLVWGAACVLIVKIIHPLIHKGLSLLPTAAGIILIAVLGAVLISDIYVTASGILKLNRRLEMMERIAAELRELSDKVGENIHENVMGTMEVTEEIKERLEAATEEQKSRVADLKEKYRELAEHGTKVSNRLLKAFPKMESRKHKDILKELQMKILKK
ncbi:putative ABC transporter permease [Extibacter muris]|uniref:putative ABC transporter permease n=1 Tax=Extibacter muris TaxID=1796622 RepID=UPI001D077FEB|nr:hypothetical protein [Extibacter muris]MCB6200725.1 hypothetical protein [Extibacter muris]MCQ4665431.1 hypothetical protein [Extibacter muris]MCQ4694772.1 hypothetical protein [Extibacter muris]